MCLQEWHDSVRLGRLWEKHVLYTLEAFWVALGLASSLCPTFLCPQSYSGKGKEDNSHMHHIGLSQDVKTSQGEVL